MWDCILAVDQMQRLGHTEEQTWALLVYCSSLMFIKPEYVQS